MHRNSASSVEVFIALAVVAQGVLGMTKQLCPDALRATIAVLAAAAILVIGQAWVQPAVVAAGGVAGLVLCRGVQPLSDAGVRLRYGARLGWTLLGLFAVLLVGLPLVAPVSSLLGCRSFLPRRRARVRGVVIWCVAASVATAMLF